MKPIPLAVLAMISVAFGGCGPTNRHWVTMPNGVTATALTTERGSVPLDLVFLSKTDVLPNGSQVASFLIPVTNRGNDLVDSMLYVEGKMPEMMFERGQRVQVIVKGLGLTGVVNGDTPMVHYWARFADCDFVATTPVAPRLETTLPTPNPVPPPIPDSR